MSTSSSPRRPPSPARRVTRWLAVALAAGLLALAAWWLLGGSAPPSDDAPDAPAFEEIGARPRLASPSSASPVARPTSGRRPASGLRIALESLGGDTRFQRRLALGSEIERLEGEWREGRLATPDALALLRSGRRGFLLLDHYLGYDLGHSGTSDHVAGLFRYLTKPARTYQALKLTTLEPPSGPFGAGARLRIWTSGEAVPDGHLAEAEDLLVRLGRLIGEEDRGGYDVLASAEMGSDVFPGIRGIPWPMTVAGFYGPLDDLCVIGTRYPDDFRRILLKHELVHAWHLRLMPEWRSRYLQEGLAEYLARLEPHDQRLAYPVSRLANEMAAFLRILATAETAGVSFGEFRLAALLSASPAEFYALGYLGYLIAVTSIACVGPQKVEEALKDRSELALAQAVAALSWAELLAFAREHAGGGEATRAVVIGDVAELEGSEAGGPRPPTLLPTTSVLRRLGVILPAGMLPAALDALLAAPRDLAAQERARLEAVLTRLVAEGPLVFATDATGSLDAWFRLAGAPDDGPVALSEQALDARSRREFVLALHGEVVRLRGGRGVEVVSLGPEIEGVKLPDLPVREPFRADGLPVWLAGFGPQAALVLCVAAREGRAVPAAQGEHDEVGRTRAYLERLALSEVRPRAVLVVDLSDGRGSARALADAFAAHLGGREDVAYWNPQQPLR